MSDPELRDAEKVLDELERFRATEPEPSRHVRALHEVCRHLVNVLKTVSAGRDATPAYHATTPKGAEQCPDCYAACLKALGLLEHGRYYGATVYCELCGARHHVKWRDVLAAVIPNAVPTPAAKGEAGDGQGGDVCAICDVCHSAGACEDDAKREEP